MLKAFRDEKGMTIGFTGVASSLNEPMPIIESFIPAFGIRYTWYVEGDQVLYGATQPAFRDFLELMAYWYSEKLIDQNIFASTTAEMNAAMTTGTAGAARGAGGGNLGPWINTGKAADPTFDLTAARHPTFDKNVYTRHGNTSNDIGDGSHGHAAISAKSRNVEVATRLLDYAYSHAGHMLYNFGVEDVSFTLLAGVPSYTEIVTNHPDRTFAQSLSNFARSAVNGPFNQDPGYLRAFYALDQQKRALDYWRQQDNPESTWFPPVSPTAAEATIISARSADFNTYRIEQMTRFIAGIDPINDATWKTYIDTMNSMGVPEVRDIQQAALDRYNTR
jgi:putative aldouronate transport system substrate-binding protein